MAAQSATRAHAGYRLGLPHGGPWRVRFTCDRQGYSPDFGRQPSDDTRTLAGA
ncbi:MAG: hypothetical protein ACLFU0_10830 [Alphaproteobacteria bacterium]